MYLFYYNIIILLLLNDDDTGGGVVVTSVDSLKYLLDRKHATIDPTLTLLCVIKESGAI